MKGGRLSLITSVNLLTTYVSFLLSKEFLNLTSPNCSDLEREMQELELTHIKLWTLSTAQNCTMLQPSFNQMFSLQADLIQTFRFDLGLMKQLREL